MRRTTFILAVILFHIFAATAQVTDAEKNLKTLNNDTINGWKKGVVAGINVAQTALINWSAGGESSFAFSGLFSGFANYKKENDSWDNSLDMGFGALNQGKKGFIKTDDRIDLLSKYGKRAFSNFYYTALVNFKTQFAPGYNYPNDSVKISNFLAPGYVLGAIGLNYIPNSYFNAFLAPFTGKITIVNDDSLSFHGAYGVVPGQKLKGEFGGYARFIYSRNDFKSGILKNVAFTSKLDLFSNYLKDPQNVVVNWENQLALKVNKYITVNLNTNLIYDHNIMVNGEKAKVQFKEILGIGFFLKM